MEIKQSLQLSKSSPSILKQTHTTTDTKPKDHSKNKLVATGTDSGTEGNSQFKVTAESATNFP